MLHCRQCLESKDANSFYKRGKSHQSICKTCFKSNYTQKYCEEKPCKNCGKPKFRTNKLCKKCLRLSGADRNLCACGLLKDLNRTQCRACYINKCNKPIIRKDGYVYLKSSNRPDNKHRVGEHILVMEQHLGRYLEQGENVHHKNGIKDDNRIENLELWIRPQPTGIRVEDAIQWAKEILAKYSNLAE